MKKIVAILLVCMLVSVFSGCSLESNDFGVVNIKMSRDDVLAQNEGRDLTTLNNNDILCKKIECLSVAGDAVYSFDEEDLLKIITYSAYPDFCDAEGLENLKTALEEKYSVSVEENAQDVSTEDGIYLNIRYSEEEYLILTIKK